MNEPTLNCRRPAVFFDRDGTLNEDRDYPHRVEDMVLIPGAARAARRLQEAGALTVIVTNQSGIARGHFDEAAMVRFNTELLRQLAERGATIDLILHCPHHPDITGPCDCRKPAPGMIFEAFAKLPIDPARSLLIGDRPSDMGCAQAAGIPGYLFPGGNLENFCVEQGLLKP